MKNKCKHSDNSYLKILYHPFTFQEIATFSHASTPRPTSRDIWHWRRIKFGIVYLVLVQRFDLVAVGLDVGLLLLAQLLKALLQLGLILLGQAAVWKEQHIIGMGYLLECESSIIEFCFLENLSTISLYCDALLNRRNVTAVFLTSKNCTANDFTAKISPLELFYIIVDLFLICLLQDVVQWGLNSIVAWSTLDSFY